MKKLLTLVLTMTFAGAFAQDHKVLTNDQGQQIHVYTPAKFGTIERLADLPLVPLPDPGQKHRDKKRRRKFTNPNALPLGPDPIRQAEPPTAPTPAPGITWDGIGGVPPPDPSGAAGLNHYIQMTNGGFQIFDKSGTSMYGPTNFSSVFPGAGNIGDPIVMYDKYADRWFLSEFDNPGKILIAISQTPDPLGAYYTYEYSYNDFHDYPKFSIWGDGYYMTSNVGSQNCGAYDRTAMLAGDANAQMVAMDFPSISTPGFFSALPAWAEGDNLPAPGTPQYFFYFQDDGWGGGSDHLKVWEMDVDWANTGNSSITVSQSIPVSAFDSQFQGSWEDIQQPGTSQRVDAVPGALMYRAQYKSWGSYNTVVLCHTVDVTGSDDGGIRWYELRDANDGNFTLYQEGTFAPDADSRWLGSISMDRDGNIGLAYNRSGSSTYPSVYYTGRYASDPLGEMTVAEGILAQGTSSQTSATAGAWSAQRWGDYAQMSVDPEDDATFWFTGEYHKNNDVATIIGTFKLAADAADDMGTMSIDAPVSGILTATESVQITIKNYGTNPQTSIPVSYRVNGGGQIDEVYNGTIAPGATASHSFLITSDMSATGNYFIEAWTGLAADTNSPNDTVSTTIEHYSPNNIGVSAITAPVSGTGLAMETVVVDITNYGTASATGFPVSYTIDGIQLTTETVGSVLTAGNTISYSFNATGNFTQFGDHEVKAWTDLTGDANQNNDTTTANVSTELCQPEANCGDGDGFINFTLGTINNDSGCEANGYGDFTDQSTDLTQGSTYTCSFESGYQQQMVSVWIDFNDNNVFDPTEIVIDNLSLGTATSGSQDITIAADAALGNHLLRARSNYQADSNDPCADAQYGETEDYMVNILDTAGNGAPDAIGELVEVGPQVKVATLSGGQYSVSQAGFASATTLSVYNSIGQIVWQGNLGASSKMVDLSNAPHGHYLFRVEDDSSRAIQRVFR